MEKAIPKCPICGKDCKISPQGVIRHTCGDKNCFYAYRQKKSKQTCIAKYGVDNPGKVDATNEKRKKTCIKKYGCTNPSKSAEIKEKKKRTLLEHYGVDHPMKSAELVGRMKKTNLEKYGVEWSAQNPEVISKRKSTNVKRYGHESSLQSEDVREKGKRTNLERYGTENPFASEEIKSRIRERNLKKYGVANPAQRREVQEKMIETTMKRYGVANASCLESSKEKARLSCLEHYGVDHPSRCPEIHSKMMSHRQEKNGGFLSLSEKKLSEMFVRRGVDFKTEYFVDGHHFDFALFKDGNLKCLVDIDGEYNHGLLSDADGKHVQGQKDCERFSKVPDGVNFVVVDSAKVTEENIAEIMETVGMDYEKFIRSIVENLPKDFPYPTYSDKRMRKDWEHLCKYDWNKGQRLGMSIVSNFHKSIWTSRVGNKPSPADAWNDKELLEKCVRNRFIYKSNLSSQNIAHGFNVCKLAPKVSVFNPSFARHILLKYAPGVKTIVDPFSGFSGRMLGACSLGMKYAGYDLNENAVKESNDIIGFLGLDASVERKNLNDLESSADVLFTCPPYGTKELYGNETEFHSCEEWIDECLARFKCGKYIFVVDEPGKHSAFVKEEISNDSHFSAAKERVIVIE